MTVYYQHDASDPPQTPFRSPKGMPGAGEGMRALAVDLFCGLGGWTDGLLAAGYNTVGFDIERHQYALPDELPDDEGTKNPGYQAESYRGKTWNDESAKRLGLMGKEKRPLTRIARYPAQLVLQDVLTIHGSQFKNASLIVCSPPCQQYSWLAMPWSRSKGDGSQKAKALRAKWESEGPDNRLFEACFRIQREASAAAGHHVPMVVENVRGAQEWVGAVFYGLDEWMAASREERWRMGRSAWNFGSFHLWGDVPALMPVNLTKRMKYQSSCSERLWKDREVPRLNQGHAPLADGIKGIETDRATLPDGTGGTSWFGPGRRGDPRDVRRDESGAYALPGGTHARKAASAMIAKIPTVLAEHIARVYLPKDQAA